MVESEGDGDDIDLWYILEGTKSRPKHEYITSPSIIIFCLIECIAETIHYIIRN